MSRETVLDRETRPEHWEMVTANMGLVHFAVNRMRLDGDEREEACQDGMFGLLRAAQKFDPTLGFTFSTYAVTWIRQYVQRGRETRNGCNFRRAVKAGELPTLQLSLDTELPHESGELTDYVADPAAEPADRAADLDEVARLASACLDDLDREILWALANGEPIGPVAIAHGYSREAARHRLRRIKRRAGIGEP